MRQQDLFEKEWLIDWNNFQNKYQSRKVVPVQDVANGKITGGKIVLDE